MFSFSVSLCLSVSLSVSVSLCLSLSLCVSLCLSLSICLFLSVFSFSLSHQLSKIQLKKNPIPPTTTTFPQRQNIKFPKYSNRKQDSPQQPPPPNTQTSQQQNQGSFNFKRIHFTTSDNHRSQYSFTNTI